MQGSIRLIQPTQPNIYFVAFKRHKLQLLLQLLDIDIFIQYFCLFYVYMHNSPARCVLWFQMIHGVPHPHPGVQGVAEKGVGVKSQPIGLYTHPHSLPLTHRGYRKNGYPMEKRYHVLKTGRKAVNLDGEESDSKKRNL